MSKQEPASLRYFLKLQPCLAAILVVLTGCMSRPPGEAAVGSPDTESVILTSAELNGTQWTLVAIQSMDDARYTPGPNALYEISFGIQGRFSAQIDCNRVGGTWARTGKNSLLISPLFSTRALCSPDSLFDRVMKDLEFTRSFTKQDGALFLATFADGAILEFRATGAVANEGLPAFACAEQEGTVENLLCMNPDLARLDVYLDEVYQAGLASLEENELPVYRAIQRGWISGRNDCWKNADIQDCIVDEYLTRISELEIHNGYLPAREAMHYRCEDNTRFAITVYPDAIRPAAIIQVDDENIMAWQSGTDADMHFQGRNLAYNAQDGGAILTVFEQDKQCIPE